ncbi:hypothetical protein [Marinilabilia salmonicolor]|uniref:hypothetical protein n=1 Tax=Marinilabilia salmonicolor TaxID=989 RepID=UPI00029A000E|nr:hypothetical protein [Marinilabilia salmonicolor]
MKKTVLIILLSISSLNLFSQLKKGETVVSLDGNYLKNNTENGVTSNHNASQIKNLNLGASVGYFIADRVELGVGLDYYWEKESRTNKLMIGDFYQAEVMDLKSNAYLPNIYIGYYHSIIDKLYLSGKVKFGYGKIKSECSTLIAGRSNYPSESSYSPPPYTTVSQDAYEADLFNVEIIPELTWFISPKVGLSLGLGGVKHTMIDWESENSGWSVNFDPAYWNFGFKIRL